MRNLFRVRYIAVAALMLAPAPKHMLYRVRGPNGRTVYLLGSVHLLNAESAKLPAEVDSAFTHSGTIAFETSLDSVKTRGAELLVRGRYPAGVTLRSSLSAATVARTDSVLHLYGLGIDQVNGFKPWLVTALVGQMAMQRANYQSTLGVDMQLNARAHEANKTIIGLEPVEFQLSMFDSISVADQEKMIASIHAPDAAAAQLARIKDAWISGNAAALDSLVNDDLAEAPSMAAILLTNRNVSWIPKIEALLNGECDALVVVGAGHLVGKQGVVELLRAKGYKVEQL